MQISKSNGNDIPAGGGNLRLQSVDSMEGGEELKTIIAGCRDFFDYDFLRYVIPESEIEITEVVSGCAAGVDRLGERWAERAGVPVKRFPADWTSHGKSAGPIRNRQMAEYADALIAIWDGESRGTKNMIETAQKLGLKVFVAKFER